MFKYGFDIDLNCGVVEFLDRCRISSIKVKKLGRSWYTNEDNLVRFFNLLDKGIDEDWVDGYEFDTETLDKAKELGYED